MCEITRNELKHINEKLGRVIDGQEAAALDRANLRKDNAKEHTAIMVKLGVSDERWKSQFKINDALDGDLEKLKTSDRKWGGASMLLAAVAGYFGLR